MAVDPVCGMQVDENAAAPERYTSQHSGQTFYFCSEECKQEFDENPDEFVRKSA